MEITPWMNLLKEGECVFIDKTGHPGFPEHLNNGLIS